VNLADRDAWLVEGGAQNPAQTGGNPFLLGDANLDGFVDGSDFGIWNANKFTANAAWCSGDFSADGFVDGSDFGVWNSNKFTSSLNLRTLPGFTLLRHTQSSRSVSHVPTRHALDDQAVDHVFAPARAPQQPPADNLRLVRQTIPSGQKHQEFRTIFEWDSGNRRLDHLEQA
jgi:hypothetical protein